MRERRLHVGACLRVCLLLIGLMLLTRNAQAQTFNPSPPAEPVKLVFIHHSCGENWLADDDGGLGRALEENNYFVSDTNYGWGPDSIGDRTDITDWPEWFTGPNSARYLAALYTESGQNSWYTRDMSDPGGENQIVMFKSCYPNSNLEGKPNEPPRRGDDLTVGNAKAIYNELLVYFSSRPDKLFIAVTAPPVQDPEYAGNARAFNNWLANDWLDDYEGTNVAVFDFYNILTGPDHHHRYQPNYIEHSWGARNTLYYPSNGDDHPSPAGNRRATEEILPLLNVYYHLWQGSEPAPPPAGEGQPAEPTATPMPVVTTVPAPVVGVIDDFESDIDDWTVFDDGAGGTRLICARDATEANQGQAALYVEYDIAPEGWASCSLVYPAPQDWSSYAGLSLYLQAGRIGQRVTIVAYQGDSADELGHFEYQFQAAEEAMDGWQRVDITWDQMAPPPWEDTGAALNPGRAMGVAFLFAGGDKGEIWVDDLGLLTSRPVEEAVATPALVSTESPQVSIEQDATATPEVETEEPEETGEGGLPDICPGSLALVLMAVAGLVWPLAAHSRKNDKRRGL